MEAVLRFTVTDDDTAAALGSGSLPVLATPRLLAWFEAATCAALEPSLPAGSTSVGTRVVVEHLAASPVGQELEVSASSPLPTTLPSVPLRRGRPPRRRRDAGQGRRQRRGQPGGRRRGALLEPVVTGDFTDSTPT
jgi:hypothetical protein